MEKIASGMRVKVIRLGTTYGMLIHDKHLKIREVGKVGVVTNWIPGRGGDVWGVQQDNGLACYCYDELEEVTEENDTPDDGLAIVAVVSSVVVLIILCGLIVLARAVGLM